MSGCGGTGGPGRSDRGFTLVEMLITLAVAGVLGAAILSLVLGQSRFYGHTDDTIYAQQSLRASMDFMASELRMASPRDLIAAEPDSVVVRFDLRHAVVCDTTSDGRAYLFAYNWVDNANLPVDFRGTAVSSPYEESWTYEDEWTGTSEAYGLARDICQNNGAPGDAANKDYLRVSGWPLADAWAGPPERGSLVRVYGKLTYRFAESSFADGIGVWRNSQELVSPFEEGASFQYVLDNGLVVSSVPVTDLLTVRAIRIDVTARGDGRNRYDVQRPISYDVLLRN